MQSEFPALLDQNINGWLSTSSDRRMLRTLDGRVRAFLSDRYRRLDNLELADAVLPVIAEMNGAEIVSAEITESRMYIKVVNTTITAEIKAGDLFQAGFVISNSEVGLGAVKVEPLIYRLACSNGLIVKDFATQKYHTGKQINSLDDACEMFSDQTIMADDMAFFMKVRDIARIAVDEKKFYLCLNRLKLSMNAPTGGDPIKTVKELVDKYTLNRHEQANILGHFMASRDLSRYSLINAVTRASQDVDDYNRATELERLGGEILAEVVG